MCDSSSSSDGRSTCSNGTARSEESVTRVDLKNPPGTSPPTSEDTTSLPAQWITERTGDAYASGEGERNRKTDPGLSKSSSGAVKRRPQVRYKTHTQLIKEKLEQITADMQKLSEQHLRLRPARKAHHPFVWNSLSPYRDTTEIDYLLAMASDQRGHDGGPLMRF